ncbi:MAG: hypothetical protein JO303_12190 [Caulobacteraceae bacterium]|nr:hypothetical protein [Caulobacteraceae bacterium]
MSPIFTLDFEASCLPKHGRSFPIEVAVATPEGEIWSWLIRPEPIWRAWTWTAEAEGLHGLTWDQLVREGRPAGEVVGELGQILAGQPAYADSYLDADWMRTLEMAAGVRPSIEVRHIDALINTLDLDDVAVAQAVLAAGDDGPRHRAGPDAVWLQALVRGLLAEAHPTRERIAA